MIYCIVWKKDFCDVCTLLQEVIDALSFELPKVVCKFACASKRCSEIAERVVGHLVSMCSPREMLSILCEV